MSVNSKHLGIAAFCALFADGSGGEAVRTPSRREELGGATAETFCFEQESAVCYKLDDSLGLCTIFKTILQELSVMAQNREPLLHNLPRRRTKTLVLSLCAFDRLAV